MADPRKQQRADFRRTLSEGPGIGQNADGGIDSFPLSELQKRTAERDSQEAATQHAMDQSDEGFPPEPEEDFEDLDADPVPEKA